jgi:hypothetical protein
MNDFNSKTKYKSCLDRQTISIINALDEPLRPARLKREGSYDMVAHIGIGMLLMAAIMLSVKGCMKEPQPALNKEVCVGCHQRLAFTVYFQKAGNKHPDTMALAVLATKSPKMMSALAVAGERNTPYTVRKGGWKKRHAGSWQLNERMHRKSYGSVPYNAVDQALQAEKLLQDLTSMPIEKALSVWGGDSTDAYQQRVLAELERKVP